MKKLFLTLAVACLGLTASAQEKGDIRFGVVAGMNVSNITDMEYDSRIGFHVGVKAEYNLSENLYGNAGVIFSQKGNKYSKGGKEETNNPGYIEVPINFGYRYKISDGVSVFGETGPYLAFGICGKHKEEYDGDEYDDYEYDDYETKADFFDNDEASKFDFGWGVKVGVEASKFQIAVGYEYGITKVFDVKGSSPHNSNLMVSVGYMF